MVVVGGEERVRMALEVVLGLVEGLVVGYTLLDAYATHTGNTDSRNLVHPR